MAWLSLIIAGLCEMFGVAMINKWNQDKRLTSMLCLITGFIGSFLFLSLAIKTLPMGTAYAIWTGIGASGGAILGMLFFNESKDWKRILFIALILGSAVGLKLVS